MKNLEFNERLKFIDSRSTAYYKKDKLQENHVQTYNNQAAENENKEKKKSWKHPKEKWHITYKRICIIGEWETM